MLERINKKHQTTLATKKEKLRDKINVKAHEVISEAVPPVFLHNSSAISRF